MASPRPSSSSSLNSLSGQSHHHSRPALPPKSWSVQENNLPLNSLNRFTKHPHADKLHLHLSAIEAETAPHQEYPRTPSKSHIHINPGFSLVQDGEPRFPNHTELRKIRELYPDYTDLSFRPPFIVIRFETLPPKPWPVTLAGLALYFTADPLIHPLNRGLGGLGPGLEIAADIPRTELPTLDIFEKIFAALDKLGIKATDLQWIAGQFYALMKTQPEKKLRSKYPATINGVLINYRVGEQAIHDRGFRLKHPHDKVYDDAIYSELCPGVLLSSKKMTTTSGVCVADLSGAKYITGAAHGFEGQCDEVRHPDNNGVQVGNIDRILGNSDIALIKLKDGIKYARQTFHESSTRLAKPFRDFTDVSKLKLYTIISLNSPMNGPMEGQLLGIQIRRIPSDETVTPHQYIEAVLTYFGNGEDILDGSCGAVIWAAQNDNGEGDWNVVGQFRFKSTDTEMCYCPTYRDLPGLGFSLSEA